MVLGFAQPNVTAVSIPVRLLFPIPRSDPSLRFAPYTPFKIRAMGLALNYNRNLRMSSCCALLFVLCLMASFGVLIWRASLAA